MESDYTLTPGKSISGVPGFMTSAIIVNNQSNCWLTQNGVYIAAPYQQCTVSVAPASQSLSLSLTTISPSGLPNVILPVGECDLQLIDAGLAPSQGVIAANLSVLSQQIVLVNNQSAPSGTTTITVQIPSFVQGLLFLPNANLGDNSSALTVVGSMTKTVYLNSFGFNKQTPLVVLVAPAIDLSVAMTIVNNNSSPASGAFSVVGLPYGVTNDTLQNVTFTGGSLDVFVSNDPISPAAVQLSIFDEVTSANAVAVASHQTSAGHSIIASDRLLDSWFQSGVIINPGGTITQPSPGVGLTNVVTTIAFSFETQSGTGGGGTLTLGSGARTMLQIRAVAGAFPGYLNLPMTNLRLPGLPATSITLTIGVNAGQEAVLSMSGFVVKNIDT